MEKKYDKQRLFEMMLKVDKSFILNENNAAAMEKLSEKQVFDVIVNSNNKLQAIDQLKDYIYNLNDEYIHYIINLTDEENRDDVIERIIEYRGNNIDSEIAFSLIIFSSNPMQIAHQLGSEVFKQIPQEDIEKILAKKFNKRHDEKEEFINFINQN